MSYLVTNISNDTSFHTETGETILEAALRHGHLYPYGCQAGSCGACKARIVSGTVDLLDRNPAVLTDEEMAQGKTLCCQAVPETDIEIEIREIARSRELEIKTLPTRVREKNLLCDDVVQLFLSLPNTQQFDFLPGQYVNLLLRNGRERAFSIANTPGQARETGLELHIRVVPGGHYSPQVRDNVQVKDIIRIQGPFGTYFLRKDEPRPIIMVAGGTGFAPVKGLIEDAIESGSEQAITLYWGARTEADLYLNALAEHWAANLPNFSYVPVLSEPGDSSGWSGRTGYVHEAIEQDIDDASAYSVYASGPPVMVDALRESFSDRGLPEDFFYSDAFDYAAASE